MKHAFSNSSSIEWAEYDEIENTMTIKFISGKEYKYEAVPIDVYGSLVNASSAGKYFQLCIRNKYKVAE